MQYGPLGKAASEIGGVFALDPSSLAWGRERCEAMAAARDATPRLSTMPGVALVPVMGPLHQRALSFWGFTLWDGYDGIAERFSDAIADEDVGAVVLVIDSPGGSVAGLEEAVARMSKAKKTSGKRVIAYVDEFAASAAYWIASALADEIVVPTAGEVGSVGVIAMWVDLSGALEAEGVKVHVHRDPEGKAPGHPYGPNAEIADERMRADVERIGKRFEAAVAKARGAKASEVRGWNAATFEGKGAVEAGLADRVGTFESVIKAAGAAAQEKMMAKEARDKLVAALGLSAEATDAEIHAAAADRVSLVASSEQRATAAEKSAKEAEDKAAKLERELEETRAKLVEERVSFDAAERDRLCVRYAKATRPFMAWADPVDAGDPEKRRPHKALAALSLDELGELVAKAEADKLEGPSEIEEAPTKVEAGALSERDLERCKAIAAKHGANLQDVIDEWIAAKADKAGAVEH